MKRKEAAFVAGEVVVVIAVLALVSFPLQSLNLQTSQLASLTSSSAPVSSTSASVSSTSTAPVSSTASATINGLRLDLGVLVNPVSDPDNGSGATVSIKVDEFNTLGSALNLTFGYGWLLSGVTLSPPSSCGQRIYPLAYGVLLGNYGLNNVSQAQPLELDQPNYPVSCLHLSAAFYIFNQSSDIVTTYASPGLASSLLGKVDVTNSSTSVGYWTGDADNGVFHTFQEGTYTVVALDEWGDAVFSHFVVEQASQGALAVGFADVAYPSSGLQLLVGVNSTDLSVGQELHISVELRNNNDSERQVSPVGIPANASDLASFEDTWRFHGWPIAVWPGCTLQLPLQFIVIQGNYTSDTLSQAVNASLVHPGPVGAACIETENVTGLVFQPSSDLVNMSSIYVAANDVRTYTEASTIYRMESNFTVSGYWDEGSLNTLDLFSTPVGTTGATFGTPEVAPLGQTQFVVGVYTLAVSDEWGQLAILHFTVS